MAKQYVNFGSINKRKDGVLTIKLHPDVKLNVNGKKFEGEYINMQKPADKLSFLLEKEIIDEDEYEKQSANYAKGGKQEFVKYGLTLVLE